MLTSVIVTYLILFIGLFVEIIASYLGVVGMQSVFSGNIYVVTLIGIGLESTKVALPIFLTIQHNISQQRKILLWGGVLILMCINAVAVYGTLTRFSLDVFTKVVRINNNIAGIENRIDLYDERINEAKQTLELFNQATEKYLEMEYVTRGLKERRKDEEEREELRQNVQKLQDEKLALNVELLDLKSERTNVQSEFGALREITGLFTPYPDDNLNIAYLIFILAILICFQPLGLMMVRSSVSELTDPTSEVAKIRKKAKDLAQKRKTAEQDIQSRSKFLLEKQKELELKEELQKRNIHEMET
tara:strand:- start:988 stop:1896 length:909 start_codon:yes stop_codon:yes gene_type:complete